jgi:hypothetical protein
MKAHRQWQDGLFCHKIAKHDGNAREPPTGDGMTTPDGDLAMLIAIVLVQANGT